MTDLAGPDGGSAAPPGPPDQAVPADTDPADAGFATTLRTGVGRSGLSLADLVQHLRRRDLAITTATLSTWQTGRTAPARRSSIPVIRELERLLELDAGALLGPSGLVPSEPEAPDPADLEPPTGAYRRWLAEVREDWGMPPEDAFTYDLILSRVRIRAKHLRTYDLDQQLRCRLDGADRYLLGLRRQPFSADLTVPDVEVVAGGQLGRTVRGVTEVPASATEVILPRALRPGEVWHVEVRTTTPEHSPSDRHLVALRPDTSMAVAQVVFEDDLPREVCRQGGRFAHGRLVPDGDPQCGPLEGRSVTVVLGPEDVGRAVELSWTW